MNSVKADGADSSPSPPRNAPPASANADLIRDFIREAVERAAVYAQHAADYAVLGDDRALNRAVRMAAVSISHAATTLPRLAAAAERDKTLSEFLRAERGP